MGGIVFQSAFVAQYIVTNVPLPADIPTCAFFCNHCKWFCDCCATQSNNTSMRYGKPRNMIDQKYIFCRPPTLLPAIIFL